MSATPKHEDPKQIEQDIDRTRSEMDETIDALSQRLSLKNMGHKAREAVVARSPTPPGGGPSFYQRRPILLGSAALAMGIGAGFLLSPPETRKGPSSKQRGAGMMARAKGTYEEARHHVQDAASGIAQTAKRTMETGKEEAKEVASTARESPSQAKEQAKVASGRVRDQAKSEAERHDVTGRGLKERARETKESARP